MMLLLILFGCTSLLAESGILRTQAGGDGSGDGHTLPRDAPDQALRLRPRLRASPPPPAPGSPGGSRAGGTLHSAGPPPGGHRGPDRWGSPFCWSLSGGLACLIAGSPIVRRPAVIRRRGSAGHSRAGTRA